MRICWRLQSQNHGTQSLEFGSGSGGVVLHPARFASFHGSWKKVTKTEVHYSVHSRIQYALEAFWSGGGDQ